MSYDATTSECPYCGQLIPAGTVRCPACGRSLNGRRPATPVGGTPPAPHRSAHLAAHAPPSRRWDLDTPADLYPVATRGGTPVGGSEGPRRKMTRHRVVRTPTLVGITLLLVGIVVVAGVYAVNDTPRTLFLPSGNFWSLAPSTLTETTAHVKWFGGTVNTRIFLVWGTPDCFGPNGVVVSGSGPSGTLSAQLDPGTSYSLYACVAQSNEAMNFTVTLSGGISLTEIGGGFLIGTGIGLMIVGLRGRTTAYQGRR